MEEMILTVDELREGYVIPSILQVNSLITFHLSFRVKAVKVNFSDDVPNNNNIISSRLYLSGPGSEAYQFSEVKESYYNHKA